ncbi:MAG: GspE/PulE family protein [Pseudomonadota bacterium]
MDGSFSATPPLSACADKRRDLLRALENRGALNSVDSSHVAALLNDNRDPLDQIICKLGLVSEDSLAAAYGKIFSLPYYKEVPSSLCSSETTELFSAAVNRRFLFAKRIAPLTVNDDNIVAAIVDPSDEEAINGISFALQKPVKPVIVSGSEFDRILDEFFPELDADANNDSSLDISADIGHLKDMASAEPIVRYVDRLISEAKKRRASDIHIEPMARNTVIRIRVDGLLTEFDNIPASKSLSVISRLKILADLDIAERRRPLDGRMSYPVGGRAIDLRLSTTPTVNGESLVIRLLDKSRAPLDLHGLGFNDRTRLLLENWITTPNGIILLTGPTGSGKTTTLYALLTMLANGRRKILTIEDPVEYRISGVNQTQVNPAIGLTFANSLRSFLRHDPDVIMVGEMRDVETAEIAIRAAMTGHLVLSTLHTNDAASAITRLLDMGVEDYLLAATLLGVVGQRLVRRRCLSCSERHQANTKENTECGNCKGTGYAGRVVISETLKVDDTVRSKIKKGIRSSQLLEAAKEQNFIPMRDDGAAKIEANLTTIAEVKQAVSSYEP